MEQINSIKAARQNALAALNTLNQVVNNSIAGYHGVLHPRDVKRLGVVFEQAQQLHHTVGCIINPSNFGCLPDKLDVDHLVAVGACARYAYIGHSSLLGLIGLVFHPDMVKYITTYYSYRRAHYAVCSGCDECRDISDAWECGACHTCGYTNEQVSQLAEHELTDEAAEYDEHGNTVNCEQLTMIASDLLDEHDRLNTLLKMNGHIVEQPMIK